MSIKNFLSKKLDNLLKAFKQAVDKVGKSVDLTCKQCGGQRVRKEEDDGFLFRCEYCGTSEFFEKPRPIKVERCEPINSVVNVSGNILIGRSRVKIKANKKSPVKVEGLFLFGDNDVDIDTTDS